MPARGRRVLEVGAIVLVLGYAATAVVLVFLLPRRAHPVGSTVVKSNSWKATTSVCQREATNSTCEG